MQNSLMELILLIHHSVGELGPNWYFATVELVLELSRDRHICSEGNGET